VRRRLERLGQVEWLLHCVVLKRFVLVFSPGAGKLDPPRLRLPQHPLEYFPHLVVARCRQVNHLAVSPKEGLRHQQMQVPTAGLAFTTTQTAAAAAGLMWMLVERWHHGKVTSLGLASGIVAGLVAITPAAGHVRVWGALIIGSLSSVVCYWAVQLKSKFKYDDSLDAFGVHGVGGILGALLTGVLCFQPVKGAIFGNFEQLGKQFVGVGDAIVYAGVGTFLIASLLKRTWGLRTSEQEERDGLDLHVHGERGYHFDQT
jgi:ammonia channel protein AmtB